MPFVQLFKGRRIQKRSAKLKGRPEWQDVLPDSKQGRDAYAIAAKYENDFAKAFLNFTRSILTKKNEEDFKRAWDSKDIRKIMATLPIFSSDVKEQRGAWAPLVDKLDEAYATVIQAAGNQATKDLNKKLKTDFVFYALPPGAGPDDIRKSWDDVRRAARGMVVDINPHSIKWIRDHGLELVTQSISEQQKEVVRNEIKGRLERGERAELAYQSIKENIGLTARDAGAVNKRYQLHLDAGLSESEAKRLTDKYRQELLSRRAQMIARTETIAAQAQGRLAAWQVAQDSGELPNVVRRWMAPPPSPNPNRPCEICLALDGTTAALNEQYDSIFGFFDGPPAHPGCRCTELLERA